MSSLDAHYWFVPGVEVFRGQRVPNPPPFEQCMMLMSLPRISISDPTPDPDALDSLQRVTFRLSDRSRTGEVVHYELTSHPPRGWRWLAVDGVMRAERIEVK